MDDQPATSRTDYDKQLGYPGQYPMTRGVYASMYRGQPWSQRQIVGLGLPGGLQCARTRADRRRQYGRVPVAV